MFEKFTSKTAGDFRQRYQGTYGFFKRGTSKTLVRLDKIVTDTSRPVVEFSDINGLKCHLFIDSEDETIGFEFLPPKMQYHNCEDGVYIVRRVPARQYLRGICDRNTAINTVADYQLPVDFTMLNKLFTSTTTPQERIVLLRKGKDAYGEQSIALSGQFAINLVSRKVYCLGTVIGAGSLTDDTLSIWLFDQSCGELR